MTPSNILIVCTGNICRSPIAEYLLAHHLQGSGIEVSSAGTAALVGAAADANSIHVMRQQGLDLSPHRARQISPILLSSADLVLVLDRTHKTWISRAFPQYLGRTFKLGAWDGDLDVADPYGKPVEAFVKAFTDTERYIKSWLAKLNLDHPISTGRPAKAGTPG